MANKKKGCIYLVPTPLLEGQVNTIPQYNRDLVAGCRYFLVESLKMGRRHIRAMVPNYDLDQVQIEELNKHTPPEELEALIAPVEEGYDIGILSDAGCPGIADPGSALVRLAQRRSVEVRPLSGPSSIFLALMASGFNGQRFTFLGYLSRQKGTLRSELKKLELEARQGTTQILMETPYRNLSIFKELIGTLSSDLHLCIACDLTGPHALIRNQSVAQWKREEAPDLHKKPCIFLVGI